MPVPAPSAYKEPDEQDHHSGSDQKKRCHHGERHHQIGAAQGAEDVLVPVFVHSDPEILPRERSGMVAVASLPYLFKFQAAALEHRHILSQGQIDGQVLEAIPQGSRSKIIAKLSPLHIEVIPRIPAQRIGIGNHHITDIYIRSDVVVF